MKWNPMQALFYKSSLQSYSKPYLEAKIFRLDSGSACQNLFNIFCFVLYYFNLVILHNLKIKTVVISLKGRLINVIRENSYSLGEEPTSISAAAFPTLEFVGQKCATNFTS
jgi:hypothetical protein